MPYQVMIEYTHGYNGQTTKIDIADTLLEAMDIANKWDLSQQDFNQYIGDITRAFVSDGNGNEWINVRGEIIQVRKDGEWIK